MTRAGGPRAEVRALLEPALPYLGAARRASTALEPALVLVGPGRDPKPLDGHGVPWQLVTLDTGAVVHVAAAPIDRVASLAQEYAPTLAHYLVEPLPAGHSWCLVLCEEGVAVHAVWWPDQPGATSPKLLN